MTASDGSTVSLADYRGKKNVVLYFYPKDFTPVCTRETCGFRDMLAELGDDTTAVIGVSADDDASHEEFRSKHQVNFALLTDHDGALAKRFGATASGLGSLLSKTKRLTFVIDKNGTIVEILEGALSASKHVDGARAALAKLA